MDDYDENQMQILDLHWSLDGKYLAACRASQVIVVDALQALKQNTWVFTLI